MSKGHRLFSFLKKYDNLSHVMTDNKLASLGDTYINFVCSLALSKRKGEPASTKVKGKMLAEALKKSGLREYLPSRMNQHAFADAAEALIVYAWLCDYVTLEDSVTIIGKVDDRIEGLTELLTTIKTRIKFS